MRLAFSDLSDQTAVHSTNLDEPIDWGKSFSLVCGGLAVELCDQMEEAWQ